jgi:hypothetical protein
VAAGSAAPHRTILLPNRNSDPVVFFRRTLVARKWFSYLEDLPCSRHHRDAYLRVTDGAQTAAMVYDHQPITDFFKRIDRAMSPI